MGNIPQNGFQGVPERICVYTDAMLANRRWGSDSPPAGAFFPLEKVAIVSGSLSVLGRVSFNIKSNCVRFLG